MKKKIILLGGGGHCKSVIDVIEKEGRFEIAGIVEKFTGESKAVLGYEIIGTDDELEKLRESYEYAIVTVGHIYSNSVRVKLFKKLKALNFVLPTIISPLAYVSQHAHIEDGSVILHHAIVNVGAKVGKNCIINSKALIEHDAQIYSHCHIATGAIVNGDVIVKANSFVGSGSVVVQGREVDGFVKAGSVFK
ncbi:acetyltransferase [Sulfurimonas sediminis]|uniref:Acetyltransferase n=1 Tax=Sulfurimonas sediminis TaxID=2590020 RepID=A0A7M1B1R1_9BACT|nr:NeuD/PglB/VioB family sugar acetyltransferase [Sulfurimonas sediminis]QOP42602.1 acetyltransferase [Sulfurimonas sediminis]